MNDEAAIPRFGAGVKFRFDAVRAAWVVLAPERLFLPDEQAVEILKLVDGIRSLSVIIDDLAARYDAPRELIAGDVETMLQGLVEKGVVRWQA
ncbi:pyrroloquinoline quinone biosynthesis peptide chaperone PqqD [Rhodopila sp.]|uniref:pyrroloquinoline quinone biosynthesis peptide chaperone PqqD n=1 Tax=Rhodopila sp. TaxID=2480087 RepID=UPI003D0EA03B